MKVMTIEVTRMKHKHIEELAAIVRSYQRAVAVNDLAIITVSETVDNNNIKSISYKL